ncbi:MAG: dipeptide/oligopeptide/nickel ABC transporter ATP-binding protein [Negativicutes bacterium]|nr:dipeptide/oligopeptide/nickel ABC transporter ATP-binding protein [Negativicutes bacterium]
MIWQAQNVSKQFRYRTKLFGSGQLMVLSGLSLAVGQREIVGLVGESGSGKTTLAHIALMLDRPDNGRLYLDGVSYENYLDKKKFYRQIQIVFQHSSEALNPRWTVKDIIEEPLCYLTQLDSDARLERIREIMEAVKLPSDLLKERPGRLSGGQAQRVSLARALVLAPKFVILDEPTSSLDVVVQRLILQMLRQIHEAMKTSFLIISHDLAAVRRIADRIAFIHDGRIVEEVKSDALGKVQHPTARRLVLAAERLSDGI